MLILLGVDGVGLAEVLLVALCCYAAGLLTCCLWHRRDWGQEPSAGYRRGSAWDRGIAAARAPLVLGHQKHR